MIPHPLGLRLDSGRSVRDQIREAAQMGARGVVVDAIGDLAPHRLGSTGRRELRHLLRTSELSLVALGLPARRPFDTTDQLDDRLNRADKALSMAYELGTNLVLAQVGPVPPKEEGARRDAFTTAVSSLGQRADRHGVRIALEVGAGSGLELRAFLDSHDIMSLAASVDPSVQLRSGIDPVSAIRELSRWVAHAYAPGRSESTPANLQPHRFGCAPGVFDWEEYLGVLEEVGYGGFLTLWPEPSLDSRAQFSALVLRLQRLN
jgi:sugar phosphate isomerase/epimerase